MGLTPLSSTGTPACPPSEAMIKVLKNRYVLSMLFQRDQESLALRNPPLLRNRGKERFLINPIIIRQTNEPFDRLAPSVP